jgi:hypothetical protein
MIPVAALIFSAASITYSAIGLRQRTKVDYSSAQTARVDELQREVEQLRRDHERDVQRITELRETNVELMRRLVRLENGKGG